MNISEILKTYDEMFGQESLEAIEQYLVSKIQEAKKTSQNDVLFTLLNEMIGFCRDTTQKEKGLHYCIELKDVLDQLGIDNTVEYGTCLLNLANAYRAFEKYERSAIYFRQCEAIYGCQLKENDFGWANLYNNWALLCQEIHDYKKAVVYLNKALKIVEAYPSQTIKKAITHSNIATSLIQFNTDEACDEAMNHLDIAIRIFEEDGGQDFHYSASLVALGDAYLFKKDYVLAMIYYQKGLNALEKHVGKNENYLRILEKFQYTKHLLGFTNNMQVSEAFYEQWGKPMIHQYFKEYENRIAIGLVGEGSDCFGFDDEISTDHDYAMGFCMWLTKEDEKKIGAKLQAIYQEFVSYPANSRLNYRRGVFVIDEFYEEMLGVPYHEGLSLSDIPEEQLALATNGKIFYDPLGEFSKIRNYLLSYYSNETWHYKLAKSIHDFSQYAQSNYPRMMVRKDVITARLCLSKAVESTVDLVYLFNKHYAPYYKWKRKGMEKFELGKKILPLLNEVSQQPLHLEAWLDGQYDATQVNTKDRCVVLFEQISSMLLEELKKQHLVMDDDLFLEKYVSQIAQGGSMNILERIIDLEWKQFDQVKNIGGRASCQNDYPTFYIMRKSQYLTWPNELLKSYLYDLEKASENGWNLITEKYARMMEYTSPKEYEEIKQQLKPLSDQRIAIQEELVSLQVSWMEEFAIKYPKMAGNARKIHTYEDEVDDTSYETYLRGEISTYSDETFALYGRFVIDCVNNDKNLTFEIMENTAKLYGYTSLKEAEEKSL